MIHTMTPTTQWFCRGSLLRRNSAPWCSTNYLTQQGIRPYRVSAQQSFHLFQHFSKELISHQTPKSGISASVCTVCTALFSCTAPVANSRHILPSLLSAENSFKLTSELITTISCVHLKCTVKYIRKNPHHMWHSSYFWSALKQGTETELKTSCKVFSDF